MEIGAVTKQVADCLDYDVDFSRWLPPGDHLTGVVVSAGHGMVIESAVIHQHIVKVWVSGGIAGYAYPVRVLVNTQGGRQKQVTFCLHVR